MNKNVTMFVSLHPMLSFASCYVVLLLVFFKKSIIAAVTLNNFQKSTINCSDDVNKNKNAVLIYIYSPIKIICMYAYLYSVYTVFMSL